MTLRRESDATHRQGGVYFALLGTLWTRKFFWKVVFSRVLGSRVLGSLRIVFFIVFSYLLNSFFIVFSKFFHSFFIVIDVTDEAVTSKKYILRYTRRKKIIYRPQHQ